MTSNSTDKDLSAAGTHIGQSLDQLRADIAALSETVARLASEGAASARSQIRDSTGRAARGASAAGEQIYQDAACSGGMPLTRRISLPRRSNTRSHAIRWQPCLSRWDSALRSGP